MIQITEDGKRRLLQVAQWIELEPDSLVMREWSQNTESASCGTVGCVAGWLVIADEAGKELSNIAGAATDTQDKYGHWIKVSKKAVELLTDGSVEIDHAWDFDLFHVDRWPEEYQKEYRHSADFTSDEYIGYKNDRRFNAKLTAKLIREVVSKGSIWW
jgi:hypothetical protein